VILSALPRLADWRWQRLMYAQVLPLAAALQGLEVFHASAVGLAGQAIGFIASSGTGKSSIAAHLVARGATLITDDVLALEPSDEVVLAHPGAGAASIDQSELDSLAPTRRARLGPEIGRSDKVHVAPSIERQPLPLAAVYYLERGSRDELRIAETSPPDPRLLLASGFLWYLRTPDYLAKHLETCALVAESVRMFRLSIPAGVLASGAAEAVEAHARAEL
jgi:hypothetical protein